MAVYYNEIDPDIAAWLEQLISDKVIADGVVDKRSITDVKPSDLRNFTQCHFFAGIGGWSYALRLIDWPDDRPVWTGSCPCQPFSPTGRGKGFEDDRHLWPVFKNLIDECQPSRVFGEQTSSPAGRDWLSVVQADLEEMGFAVGAADLCSAGVGAPNIRQRLYFGGIPYSSIEGLEGLAGYGDDCGEPGRLNEKPSRSITESRSPCRVSDAERPGCEGRDVEPASPKAEQSAKNHGTGLRPLKGNSFWRDPDWLLYRDSKWRPVEPGTFPLVTGLSNKFRKVAIHGFGNAINPEVAARFAYGFESAVGDMSHGRMGASV